MGKACLTGGLSKWAGRTDDPRLHGQQLPPIPFRDLFGSCWLLHVFIASGNVCVCVCVPELCRTFEWSLSCDGRGGGGSVRNSSEAGKLYSSLMTVKCSAVFRFVLRNWGSHSGDKPCGAWQGRENSGFLCSSRRPNTPGANPALL